MGYLDQIKQALAKKHAADHPDAKKQESGKAKSTPGAPVINKPPKKVTGRGR